METNINSKVEIHVISLSLTLTLYNWFVFSIIDIIAIMKDQLILFWG